MRVERGRHGLRRGLTLLELVVAFGLVGFVLMTALPNLGRSRSSTKAAAEVMVTVLQEARQRAINQGVPVAVVVPSGNGAYGHSSAYYILEGEHPRVTEVVDLGREQPGVGLFVGSWGVNATSLSDPTALPSVSLPLVHHFEGAFDPGKWQMPEPKDYAFIFAPSGKFYSNGLPHFDGATHLVVTHGVEVRSGSLPPGTPPVTTAPNVFQPVRLGSPYTIAVNPVGQVSVHTGLAGHDGVVTIVDRVTTLNWAPAPAVGRPGSPVVTDIEVTTNPTASPPAAGGDELVGADETVSLQVRATGSGPLFCEVQATEGKLSHDRVPMEWDQSASEWVSQWSWRTPPSTTAASINVNLSVSVSGEAGTTTSSKVVTVSPESKVSVLFRDSNNVLISNPDGTGIRRLMQHPPTRAYSHFRMAPDGRSFVAYLPNGVGFAGLEQGVFEVWSSDGVLLSSTPSPPTHKAYPTLDFKWNPQGTQVALVLERASVFTGDLFVLNADGSGCNKVFEGCYFQFNPEWASDGQRIAITRNVPGSNVLSVAPDGSNLVFYSSEMRRHGPFSPDGRYLSGNRVDRTVGYQEADGSGAMTVLPIPSPQEMRAWPELDTIVVGMGRNHQWYRTDGTALGPSTYGIDVKVASDSSYHVYDIGTDFEIVDQSSGWSRVIPATAYADIP